MRICVDSCVLSVTLSHLWDDNEWLLDVHIRTYVRSYLVYVYIRQDQERERKVLISNE